MEFEKMITAFTGPMHSGKSAAMFKAYKKIWNKEHILCFKPKIDTRDFGKIKSRDFKEGIDAVNIETFDEILDYYNQDIRTIFIDEAQLISGNVSVLSYLSISHDVDIYVAGLNMTSEQDPFLSMPYILAISDEVINVKASCFDCGRGATYTYFDGVKDSAIVVGNDNYISLCTRCLKLRRGEGIYKLIRKKEEKL